MKPLLRYSGLIFALTATCMSLGSTSVMAVQTRQRSKTRKGRLYLSWGYNRAAYTPSDIHFTGPNYDFTLHGVTAKDKPTKFSFDSYFNPLNATIPQYESRVSYFISERTSISIGMAHLKYVVVQGQGSNISGFIDSSAATSFAGNYDFDPTTIASDFLRFEHTNGLNYESIEIETLIPLSESSNHSQGLYFTTAVGVGIVTPKSDVTLFSERRSDAIHLAGYGINSKLGLRFEFLNRFFVKGFANLGYLKLPSILTRSGDDGDRASQSFYFVEGSVIAGVALYTF